MNKFERDVERFNQIVTYKTPSQSKRKLYEYTFVNRPMTEDDTDNTELPPQNGQQTQNTPPDAQNQGGGMNGQQMGEMPPEASQMPPNQMNDNGGGMPMGAPMDGGQMQGGDTGMDMGGEQMQGGDPGMDMGGEQMQGGDPDMDMGGDFDGEGDIETEEMDNDDEVIDVDDLTKSQEATEYKVDGVDDRLAKLFAVVKKFSDKLDSQESSIRELKDEFEKRNPTPEEKLNLRSQSSYPYSELPKDYWNKKAKENPYYDIMYDNDVSPSEEQKKFEIRKGDINGINMKDISDTLDIDQNLENLLDF